MPDKVYAVIDTNVIVSALISKKAASYPLSVMAHVYSGVIIPVFNNEIINEYKDVLSREKFHLVEIIDSKKETERKESL